MRLGSTIRGVAEAAGVSITTVSFVLNNRHPQVDAIPKETRERVKACAEALGYRRNPAAAALRTGRSLWIGVMMRSLKDEREAWFWAPYELSLLSGIQKALSENGYFTVLDSVSPWGNVETLDPLVSSGIGGLILRCPSPKIVEQAEELRDSGIPVIAVFPANKQDLYPYSLDLDNFKAGQLAAEVLIKSGCTSPLYVVSDDIAHWDDDRTKGFCDVMDRMFGYRPMVYELPDAEDSVRVGAIAEAIKRHKPDAIMCPEGGAAFLASMAADKLKINIPQDLVILGFDCDFYPDARKKKLSAIGSSWWRTGQSVARYMLDIVQNGTKWTEPRLLDPIFVPGDSTPSELTQQSFNLY